MTDSISSSLVRDLRGYGSHTLLSKLSIEELRLLRNDINNTIIDRKKEEPSFKVFRCLMGSFRQVEFYSKFCTLHWPQVKDILEDGFKTQHRVFTIINDKWLESQLTARTIEGEEYLVTDYFPEPPPNIWLTHNALHYSTKISRMI